MKWWILSIEKVKWDFMIMLMIFPLDKSKFYDIITIQNSRKEWCECDPRTKKTTIRKPRKHSHPP